MIEEASSVECQVLSRARASRVGSPLGAPTSNFTPHTSHSAEGQLRGNPTIPVFYHSTIPRQTNPISGRAEGRTSAVWIRSCDEWDTGEAVEKQTQFRRHGRSRPWYSWALAPMLRNALRRLPACAGMTLLRTGLLRQTNPILARAIWRISVV
jgi:hypothetical protein